ncbi:TMEM175 family protein [Butyricicoccus faecihominis]|nr:TMEM175 family protein [Butyricicoccus faecihominis]
MRVKEFSDGVIAIAITPMAFGYRCPNSLTGRVF